MIIQIGIGKNSKPNMNLLLFKTISAFSLTDANVRKHLQRAEEKLNREVQKEKAMYRGMFSSSLKSNSGEGINQTNRSSEGVQLASTK